MKSQTTRTVELMHRSSIPGAWWCTPIGWEPANEIEGAEFTDGSWWDETGEVAGLVCFGDFDGHSGETIEIPAEELRVASCGNCRVIESVRL